MKKHFVVSTLLMLAVLSSCTRSSGGGQRATVLMRNGTTVSGTVVSNSGSEIQIAGDDKVTRTIPMTQVRSIDYDETPPATSASNPPPVAISPPPGASPPPASAPPAATAPPRPPREAPHREHYHPVESAVTTKTYELPTGTEISVRTEDTIDSGRAAEGQTFPAEVTNDVMDSTGKVVIPRGSNAQIIIRS